MHAHFEQVEWGPIYLAAGVTTVRDCGNEFEFITAVRDAIAQGRGLGPRLLLAGFVDGTGPLALGVDRVDTPEQARMWIDRYHDAGFQQMKIYSSVKLEEVKAVADEAHRLGMTVTGHVPEGLNAYQAIEAGQDQINHIHYIADIMQRAASRRMPPRAERRNAAANLDLDSPEAKKALAFLKEHHTVVDPTMALFELFTATTAKPPASFEPGIDKIAPELRSNSPTSDRPTRTPKSGRRFSRKSRNRRRPASCRNSDRRWHRSGCSRVTACIAKSSCTSQAGFTPMEAIQAATIVPARVMGLDKELGTVEKGKRGDLILINGNPLEDIHNTRNVEYVITNGTMYHTAELWQSVGFKP